MKRVEPCKIALAFISSLALAVLMREKIISEGDNFLQVLNNILDSVSLPDTYVFFSLLYFFNKIELSHDIAVILLGGIFSLFTIIGKSYWQLGTWEFINSNKYQFIIAAICLVGLWCFYILVLTFFEDKLKNSICLIISEDQVSFKKNFWKKCVVFLLLCWLPYIVIDLPGSLPYDGYRQLNMAMGIQKMSNHHPYLMSLFLGKIFALGRNVNDNFGIFLIVIFNSLFSASIYAYVVKCLKLWGATPKIYLSTLLFYGLIPMWGGFVQAVIKDTLYFPLFCLYFIAYINLFQKLKTKQKITCFFLIQYIIFSVLLMISRNNGFYIVFPATFLLLLVNRKNSLSLMITLLCIFSINIGYNKVLLPKNNVEAGGIQEMLSVPFQQTARFVKYYGDELSDADRSAIDHILDYSKLTEKYNPDKSDPVKDTIRSNITKNEWKAYAKVYLEMLKKHPGVFIQATINNIYGYFYPPYKCKVLLSYNYYIESKPQVATGDLNIYYYNTNSIWREYLIAYSNFWQLSPGFAMLQSPGFYTWILIILIVILVKVRMYKELIVMSVPILHLAICVVSPVNGLLRYAMPLMAITPLMLCWTLKLLFDGGKISVKREDRLH